MKTIELDLSLKPKPYTDWALDRMETNITERKYLFPMGPNQHETKGFLTYIVYAYECHYSVVINPTDIWYMMLAELAAIVKKNSKPYEKLFTTSPGKKSKILVPTNNPETIDPHMVIEVLKKVVPTDVNTFMPDFTTDTIVSKMSMSIAFCDMVSPYYSYGTFLCGIPTVTIGGNQEDWDTLLTNVDKIRHLMGQEPNDYLLDIMKTVREMLEAAEKNDVFFFNKMVSTRPCGSGSDMEVDGWIFKFMNPPKEDRRHKIMLKNVHAHVSKMEYENEETKRTFELYTGIFTSELKGQLLLPCYNSYRIETTGTSKAEKKKFAEGPTYVKQVNDPVIYKIREPGIHVDITQSMQDAAEKMLKEGKSIIDPGVYNDATDVSETPKRGFSTSFGGKIVTKAEKKCTSCEQPMTDYRSRGWKHNLCPNCAYITIHDVENAED